MSRAAGDAHVEQRADPSMPKIALVTGRQRRAGAAAELLDLGEHQPVHLGHHPGADREIGAAQAEDHKRRRHGDYRGDHAASTIAQSDRCRRSIAKRKQQIAAEADKRLLADRDETGIAREQIPALRQRQHGRRRRSDPGSARDRRTTGSAQIRTRSNGPQARATRDARVAVAMAIARCRLPRTWFPMLPSSPASIDRARKQAARPQHQHDQKGDVAGKDLPFRVDAWRRRSARRRS